jgi:membrane protein DedA with SNARE-associated domain
MLLGALVIAFFAPMAAVLLAVGALIRQPRVAVNWVTLGCAAAVVFGQAMLFLVTRFL